MRDRLLSSLSHTEFKDVTIHLSRVRDYDPSTKNILWCHDLPLDPESAILNQEGWKKFNRIVFVSQWQRDQYVNVFGIPYSRCTVIPNCIVKPQSFGKTTDDTIRFIYHTTPHRGLVMLYSIFDHLTKHHSNIYLDVYSSFKIYGWEVRDKPYEKLFGAIKDHPNMSYHGARPNEEVLEALKTSDVFLYPCAWTETSCIAMIEALSYDVLCIHPNLGALTETSQGKSIIYDITENQQHHMQRAYDATRKVLQYSKEDINKMGVSDYKNTYNSFIAQWQKLLMEVKNDR